MMDPRKAIHLLKDMGFSQQQIGEMAGVSQGSISRIDRGLSTSYYVTTARLNDALRQALDGRLHPKRKRAEPGKGKRKTRSSNAN